MKNGVLTPSLYTWCKWFCVIVLPALATLVNVICSAIGKEEIGKIAAQIITAVATFLGTILCISNYNFYKKDDSDGNS